jgi:hypothetical protein
VRYLTARSQRRRASPAPHDPARAVLRAILRAARRPPSAVS